MNKIKIEKGTKGCEKGLYFASYTDDDSCLGVGKTEKMAKDDLVFQYKSLGEAIKRATKTMKNRKKEKEYEVRGMAECFVDAKSEKQAFKKMPSTGDWDLDQPEAEDMEDGTWRIFSGVSMIVMANSEEEAFDKSAESGADAEWEFDGFVVDLA